MLLRVLRGWRVRPAHLGLTRAVMTTPTGAWQRQQSQQQQQTEERWKAELREQQLRKREAQQALHAKMVQQHEQPQRPQTQQQQHLPYHASSSLAMAGAWGSDQVTLVQDVATARRVVDVLERHGHAEGCFHAVDTEAVDIDLKEQGPVGHGRITCFSVYSGPDLDFGDGPGTALWVDVLDGEEGMLDVLRPWLEDPRQKKVFHNFSFDKHMFLNAGLPVRGFAGDTFHMARLWNTARDKAEGGRDGYSLHTLSRDLIGESSEKTPMIDLFGVPKIKKDGTPGKIKELPPLDEVQRSAETRLRWIQYSVRDAIATWNLRAALEDKLRAMEWRPENAAGQAVCSGTMWDFYQQYFVPFGDLLTELEREGIRVDATGHLQRVEQEAHAARAAAVDRFRSWAANFCADAQYMNPSSTAQIQTFLFGHYERGQRLGNTREFKIDKSEEEIEQEELSMSQRSPYLTLSLPELKALCGERGIKKSGKRTELMERLLDHDTDQLYTGMDEVALREVCVARGLDGEGAPDREALLAMLREEARATKAYMNKAEEEGTSGKVGAIRKWRNITVTSVGMTPTVFTPAGTPAATADVLRSVAGTDLESENPSYGSAFEFFGGAAGAGAEACHGLGALCDIGWIDTMIGTFLLPLQELADENSRVHCSLNLNTETGRLSARKPNLQNQPALEKDQYKIRDAFVAEEGKTFIVADYGQLELRVLAHIANCKSMIDAFARGGCFHSRTAASMFPHIQEAIDRREVLLDAMDAAAGQSDSTGAGDSGSAPPPLVKDVFASERRQAKTLNFSIAYGKTVKGLALDWSVSEREASGILAAWYADRPEVKQWQDETRALAQAEGYVRTIMGRYRMLPDAMGSRRRGGARWHALRAAINTPIQGSAADIVMMAMLKLDANARLRELGWKLILQIHDEVILEGPKETHTEAMQIVRRCMEEPFDNTGLHPLRVKLEVDAKSADSWYAAK